ncbi:protein D1 [Bemisia tabaci]|uniref:protein D1 n=2 Tax=Bemisia tabaci TaxID=7038 RepID=UPI003B2826F6
MAHIIRSCCVSTIYFFYLLVSVLVKLSYTYYPSQDMSDIDPLTITHEDITNRLKIYGIIPDILASAPPYFAKITFGPRLCPSMGQQVELHQVKYPPVKLEWPALEDDFFTLLLVDIDAPSKMAPYEREYLHWMAVNIQGPDLKTDEIVVDYISPHPLVGTGNHRFVFFVLRQPDGEIEFREGYLNALHHDDSRRTSFSSRFFAKHYEMEFYAVNFLRIEWSSPDSQYRPWHHKK